MDATSPSPAPTLLVVDDNALGLKATVRILQQAGYAVAQAADGAEALRQVRALRPALVLLDVVMPDISGTEVLRQIRADPDLAGVSVVMFSALMTQSNEQAVGLDAGADGYIVRPVSNQELVARVRSQLRQRELTEQVRASEAQYRRLFEAAKDGILILNAETGMIEDVNPFLTELLGFTREQVLRKKVWELGCFKHLIANQEKFTELQRVGYVRYGDLPLEAADGRKIAVEFVSNVYEVNGAQVIQCNIRNITERKAKEEELRDSEQRFAGAFADAPIGMALVSPETRWLKVNRALCDLLGYSEAELLNRSVREFTHPDDLGISRDNVDRALANEVRSFQIEKRYVHKDGHFITALLSISLVRDSQGRPRYFISQIQDITERKRAEEVVKHRVVELERFHRLSVGRELQMVDLKKEVNALATLAGRTPPYDLAFLEGKMGPQTKP
jgi:PAS domain S-box-containing protein